MEHTKLGAKEAHVRRNSTVVHTGALAAPGGVPLAGMEKATTAFATIAAAREWRVRVKDRVAHVSNAEFSSSDDEAARGGSTAGWGAAGGGGGSSWLAAVGDGGAAGSAGAGGREGASRRDPAARLEELKRRKRMRAAVLRDVAAESSLVPLDRRFERELVLSKNKATVGDAAILADAQANIPTEHRQKAGRKKSSHTSGRHNSILSPMMLQETVAAAARREASVMRKLKSSRRRSSALPSGAAGGDGRRSSSGVGGRRSSSGVGGDGGGDNGAANEEGCQSGALVLPDLLARDVKGLSGGGSMSGHQRRIADITLGRGHDALARGDTEAATRLFSRVIDVEPGHFLANMTRAVAHSRAGRLQSCTADLDRCATLQPRNALVPYNRGTVLAAHGQLAEAEQAFSAAIALDGTQQDFFLNRALVNRRMGRFIEARADYYAARHLAPPAAAAAAAALEAAAVADPTGPDDVKQSPGSSGGGGDGRASPTTDAATGGARMLPLHEALLTPPAERSDQQIELLIEKSDSVRFLRKFPHEDAVRIWQHLEYRKFEPGEHVFEEGDAADYFYIILTGSVWVQVSTGKGEITANTINRGESFGELAVIRGAPRNATVVVNQMSEMLLLPAAAYKAIVLKFEKLREAAKVGLYRRFTAFAPLPDEAVNKLASISREMLYSNHTTIIMQGAEAQDLFLITKGLVRITKSFTSNEGVAVNAHICTLSTGDIFGETSLIEPLTGRYPSTCLALTPVEAVTLNKRQFDHRLLGAEVLAAIRKLAVHYPSDTKLAQMMDDNKKWVRGQGGAGGGGGGEGIYLLPLIPSVHAPQMAI